MRVALHLVKQRRERLNSLIRADGFLTLAEICRRLDVSEATARRDLAAVAADGGITRTRGGGTSNPGAQPGSQGARAAGADAPGIPAMQSPRPAATPARATLQNIADRTGFAKTTVSLSLRDHPRIPEATRRIVRAAARELDYRPDPALSRIAENRWRIRGASSGSVIAFITTNDRGPAEVPDAPAMEGAHARARELGYGFEHFRLEGGADAAGLGRVLFHRGIRGVIVGQLSRGDFCDRFPWNLFSAVGCDTGLHRPPIHVVVPDTAHAVVQAWQRALEKGFQRIGMALVGNPRAGGESDRMCAAHYCQSLLPPEVRRVPVLRIEAGDKAVFLRWVRRQHPDLVLGFDDTLLGWLREAGYQVPGDIGFISLKVRPHTDAQPGIAGIDDNRGLIGQAAVEQLDILIRTNKIGIPARPFALMVESGWVPGETIGNATDRPAAQARELSTSRS